MAINLTQLEPGTCSDAATSEKQPFDYFIMTSCTTSEKLTHMAINLTQLEPGTCSDAATSEKQPFDYFIVTCSLYDEQNNYLHENLFKGTVQRDGSGRN
jgi:hypothetical protein